MAEFFKSSHSEAEQRRRSRKQSGDGQWTVIIYLSDIKLLSK